MSVFIPDVIMIKEPLRVSANQCCSFVELGRTDRKQWHDANGKGRI